jgi:hypothetical protein
LVHTGSFSNGKGYKGGPTGMMLGRGKKTGEKKSRIINKSRY